jgi:hypothetical protein
LGTPFRTADKLPAVLLEVPLSPLLLLLLLLPESVSPLLAAALHLLYVIRR